MEFYFILFVIGAAIWGSITESEEEKYERAKENRKKAFIDKWS